MTIGQLFSQSTKQLELAGIKTARLDALILLEKTLQKDRSWLLAHPDKNINSATVLAVQTTITKRAQRIPLAYLTSHQEFYSRDFFVTPNVLIPRPETEALIEMAKKLQPKNILDVGTGSGAIAITLAIETNAKVTASDISNAALKVAQKNAASLGANVQLTQSDLLKKIPGTFDLIVANLPYVDRTWQVSPETNYEPKLALFANNDGLELIKNLLAQAPSKLSKNGHLILEADPRQHAAIIQTAKLHGLGLVALENFALCFKS